MRNHLLFELKQVFVQVVDGFALDLLAAPPRGIPILEAGAPAQVRRVIAFHVLADNFAVDGSGTTALNLGSSGNGTNSCTDTGSNNKCGDLEYDAAAFDSINGFAGADPTPNTFRQLPAGQ